MVCRLEKVPCSNEAVMNLSNLVVQSKHQIRLQYSIPFLESSMPPGLNLRCDRSFDVVIFHAAPSDPCVMTTAYLFLLGVA